MAALETDLLAELIREKQSCLVQLRDMGRRQQELVEADEMTALLELLSAKQRMLVQLQRIERALDPFRPQDPRQRRWRRSEDRRLCAEQLQQCETLLAQIIDQEKSAETALQRRRDEAAARLQGIHLAGQARGAYTAASENPAAINASQLDLLSES